jgi:MoaA/NifB/PqqE/SkfB family radical SAM enzyme
VEGYYKEKREPATLEDLLSVSATLNRVNVSGGEPNLSLLLMDYLEKLVELGLSKKILLKINTNAVMNAPRLMKVYKEFRRVELLLSIDGTHGIQEYIRHPSKWPQIENTVRELKDHFAGVDPMRYRILAAPTYQALNILNLRELVLWCEKIGIEWSLFHKIIDPDYLQVDVLPGEIREVAAQRLERFLSEHRFSAIGAQEIGFIIHHLRNSTPFDPAKLSTFLKYNGTLDKIRHERFAEGCPELHDLLQKFLGQNHLGVLVEAPLATGI